MGRLSIAILLVVVLLASSIFTGGEGLFEDTAGRYCDQCYTLFEQGRLDEAIDKYTEAIRVNPSWDEAYFN